MESKALYTHQAKKIFKKAFREISEKERNAVYAEAAYPAYAHRNPLIDRLFWGRLEAVENYIKGKPPKIVLDFGCGSGVMSYILSNTVEKVYATDAVPETFERMKSVIPFPQTIESIPLSRLETCVGTIDTIAALDVLEHVEDLPGTLESFKKILKPGGEVIISGPTENILYKIGRIIAGRRFTGDYHVRTIEDIWKEAAMVGEVKNIKTLYPILPFFKIFSLKFK